MILASIEVPHIFSIQCFVFFDSIAPKRNCWIVWCDFGFFEEAPFRFTQMAAPVDRLLPTVYEDSLLSTSLQGRCLQEDSQLPPVFLEVKALMDCFLGSGSWSM